MKHLKWFVLVVIFFSTSTISYSQKEKEVKVKLEEGKLYGSLISVPEKSDAPIVIIIPGSGPTDRNGNSMMVQANSYRLLAEGLAEEGIASLRYDKLMIGKSKSDLEEKDLRFETNVDQVTAWIDYLTKKKYSNIILIGHSEGSLIGMLAAQKRKVTKFISLSGTGRNIDEVLIEQLAEQYPEFEKEAKTIFEQLKKGKHVDDISTEMSGLFRKSVQPYLISWLKYAPKEEIGKLAIPVLILHGSTDIQVTMEDANLQAEGSPKAELKIIDGMNHVLKEAPEDKDENMKTYYNPKLALHPELIPVLVGFIK
jgi:hypothetical protein